MRKVRWVTAMCAGTLCWQACGDDDPATNMNDDADAGADVAVGGMGGSGATGSGATGGTSNQTGGTTGSGATGGTSTGGTSGGTAGAGGAAGSGVTCSGEPIVNDEAEEIVEPSCEALPSECLTEGMNHCSSAGGAGGIGSAEEIDLSEGCVALEGDLPGENGGLNELGPTYFFTAPVTGVYTVTVDARPGAVSECSSACDDAYMYLDIGTTCGGAEVKRAESFEADTCVLQVQACLEAGTVYFVEHPAADAGYAHSYRLTIEAPE